MRRIETFEWWSDLLKLKDQYSLRELADRFDVTPGAITAAFKRTNTSRQPAPPGPRSRRPAVKGAEEVLPPEPGEAPKRRRASGATRPGSKDDAIAAHADLLGKVSDAQVAKKAGVSVRTVAAYRARNKIAGYSGPRRRGADKQPRKSKIDSFSDLVGTVPDRVVAEKAGVSINAVRNWRQKRNVGASRRRADAKPAAAAPAASPPRTAGGSAGAWRVVAGAERVVRVVVATSLVEAAARAEGAGLGSVVSLEWIGEIL